MPPATPTPSASGATTSQRDGTGTPPRSPLFTARIIHAYMLVIHLALPAILYYVVGHNLDVGALFSPSSLSQIGPVFASLTNQLLGAAAVLTFAAGWIVPQAVAKAILAKIRKPGTMPSLALLYQTALLPFLARVLFFEMTTLLGFVVGLRTEVVAVALPFAAAGLAATMLSPPTPSLLLGLYGDPTLVGPNQTSGNGGAP